MILSFKTHIKRKPTNFVNKIWIGLIENNIVPGYTEIISNYNLKPYDVVGFGVIKPKLHTIRKDEKKRWKTGMMIDFFINARQKNMFQFAPKIQMVCKQNVFMTYMPHLGNGFEVSIDGRQLGYDEIEVLAVNDGFESFNDFAEYFIAEMKDDEFTGIIIHWTDLRY